MDGNPSSNRGHGLRDVKQRRPWTTAPYGGLTVSLVAQVERGTQRARLGAVIRHGMAQPGVQPVAAQPVCPQPACAVRPDPTTQLRYVQKLRATARKWISGPVTSFRCHAASPSCRSSITYLLTDGSMWSHSAARNVEDYLDYVSTG